MTGIRFIGERNPTGYGRAAHSYLQALHAVQAPVRWTPMVPGNAWGMYLQPQAEFDAREHRSQALQDDTACLCLLPQYFPRWMRELQGKRVFGMVVWETERIPASWLPCFEGLAGLVVPNAFTRDACLRAGTTLPVHVVPYAATEPLSAAPSPVPITGMQPQDFVFYTIGQWSQRKGTAVTIDTFLRAFTAANHVCLVVKTGPTDESKRAWGRYWNFFGRHFASTRRALATLQRKHRNPARVLLLPDPMQPGELSALHQRADCYLSLTRAEGWGLGAFEAAQHGKPVIITAHPGPCSFLPPHLAYLVDFKWVPLVPEGAVELQAFPGQQRWAEPDQQQAIAHMRHVLTHREEARQRGRGLQAHVRNSFCPSQIGNALLRILEGA